jgi:hypothetical protein
LTLAGRTVPGGPSAAGAIVATVAPHQAGRLGDSFLTRTVFLTRTGFQTSHPPEPLRTYND